jgi:hypothetical protein
MEPMDPLREPVGEVPSEEPTGDSETSHRTDFPPVRFPRLELPLTGAEPRGLGEDRPVVNLPPLPAEPKLSMVLYNRDDADRLWNFMFALKAQTRPPDEILLVDNHSSDASVSFLRANYPDVRVMELQEVFPKDQAMNLGFLAATGDLVALVDTSLALPPEWLRRAVENFRTRAALSGAALCPVVGPVGAEAAPIYNILGREVGSEAPYPGGEPFALSVGAVLVRRRIFPDGPYEESLTAGPDPFALGWRLRAFGAGAVWAFDARVLRPADSAPPAPSPFRFDFDAERRRACAFRAFAESGTRMKLAPLWVLEALVRPFRRWFHPEGSFWGTVFGLMAVPFALAGLGKAAERMSENRRAKDGDITASLSSRVAIGDGILSELWNAFCAAYLAAVGIPTRENPVVSQK